MGHHYIFAVSHCPHPVLVKVITSACCDITRVLLLPLQVRFTSKFFEEQHKFMDKKVVQWSRERFYEELAPLAEAVGVDKSAFLANLEVTQTGTRVTEQLMAYTKYHRTRGIHTTPTAMINGVVEPTISR